MKVCFIITTILMVSIYAPQQLQAETVTDSVLDGECECFQATISFSENGKEITFAYPDGSKETFQKENLPEAGILFQKRHTLNNQRVHIERAITFSKDGETKALYYIKKDRWELAFFVHLPD